MTIEKVVSGQPNELRASFNYDNFTDPNDRLTPAGMRRRVDEQIEYSGFARTVNFAYDGLNRLKQETIAPGTTVYGTITYDTAPGHSETDGSLQARGWKIRNGGGRGSEERIPGPGGGTQGETWVDLTAEKTIGTTLKTNGVDELPV